MAPYSIIDFTIGKYVRFFFTFLKIQFQDKISFMDFFSACVLANLYNYSNLYYTHVLFSVCGLMLPFNVVFSQNVTYIYNMGMLHHVVTKQCYNIFITFSKI